MSIGRRLSSSRSVGPWQLVAIVLGVVVVILLVSTQWGGGEASSPPQKGAEQPAVPSGMPSPVTAQSQSELPAQTSVPSSSSTPARSLSGRELAAAWLTGYLNRSSRDDGRWADAIRDITDPDLLAQLQTSGADAVGLFRLSSWRVTAVTPYDGRDQPVDTPSRQVLAYTAAVTDGDTTEQKPFLLYCYRSADQRWLVSMIEQPYTSEN